MNIIPAKEEYSIKDESITVKQSEMLLTNDNNSVRLYTLTDRGCDINQYVTVPGGGADGNRKGMSPKGIQPQCITLGIRRISV